jgi:hypothetical protein
MVSGQKGEKKPIAARTQAAAYYLLTGFDKRLAGELLTEDFGELAAAPFTFPISIRKQCSGTQHDRMVARLPGFQRGRLPPAAELAAARPPPTSAAHLCRWLCCNCHLRAGADYVKRPAEWCKKYGERFWTEGTVHDAPRSGRPRLITVEDAERAADLLCQGHGTGKREDGFCSIKEAAQHNPDLGALLKTGTPQQCSTRTLQRAIKRAKPYLGKVTVHHAVPLTQLQREKRVVDCKWNLRKWREDRSYFRSVVSGLVVSCSAGRRQSKEACITCHLLSI